MKDTLAVVLGIALSLFFALLIYVLQYGTIALAIYLLYRIGKYLLVGA